MSKMLKFSIDHLTGQNAPERNDESSFSEDVSSSAQEDVPSPIFSEDGCTFVDGLLSLDMEPTSLDHRETDGRSHAKRPHSYIALISLAILSKEVRKISVSEMYIYIMDKFPYYNNKDKAWRNSIRHNLSLNECFIKSGHAQSGKGSFWSIHPACVDAFSRGDYRRRQARRRARKCALARTVGVSNLPFSYGNSLGYVPMTPSTVAPSAYRPCYTPRQHVLPGGIPVPSHNSSRSPGFVLSVRPQPTHGSPSLTSNIAQPWGRDFYRAKDFAHTE